MYLEGFHEVMELIYHQAVVGEQFFHENQESMDLLDKFTDGGWLWWRSFCEVFLDSIWGLVGCKVKV